jgi:hypothetical protein
MTKLSLAAVLFVAIAGCAHTAKPALMDSSGSPYPSWAAMDGLVCYDHVLARYVPARQALRDGPGRDYVCDYGPVNRGVRYDETSVTGHATAPAVTRGGVAPYPSIDNPTSMR